jgi:hypothetical protein
MSGEGFGFARGGKVAGRNDFSEPIRTADEVSLLSWETSFLTACELGYGGVAGYQPHLG